MNEGAYMALPTIDERLDIWRVAYSRAGPGLVNLVHQKG